MKYCQGPKCHTYYTQDRIRGPKGNKTTQTRRRSSFYYGGENFCSLNCQNDWFNDFGDRAIDHFGRTTQPIRLGPENAWVKDYDYSWQNDTRSNWRFVNKVTKEQRPLTQEQYNDSNYTLNER
jgi:hypothetical protein